MKPANKIRIIGGDWRSRLIRVVDADGLRPTPTRVRETLFNWLQQDILASRCLDLYAGSGALSFEAASRGAKTVVQIENNAAVCKVLQENATALAASQIQLLQTDALRYLAGTATPFDIVFVDPPFDLQLTVQSCQLLENNGWLKPHAKIYLETPRGLELTGLPENWRLLKSKTAGDVGYSLFQRC